MSEHFCEHPWDDHVFATFVTEDDQPQDWHGQWFCPVPGCDCTGTWSVAVMAPEAAEKLKDAFTELE